MNAHRYERSPGAARTLCRLTMLPLAASLVAGCVSVPQRADDTGDVCWSQRAELRGSQEYYSRAIAEGAAMGAVLGGITGLLSGQSGKSTAIGAAAGAVAGGIGGYYLAKQRVASDAAALNAAVYQDVVGANQEIDKATLAFAKLRDCRYAAARQVTADWRAGRITRPEAERRLAELRRQFDEDVRIADEVGAKMSERAREYRYAADELARQEAPAIAATTSQARSRPASGTGTVASVTQTNQIKQRAFTDEVQMAKSKAPAVFSLEGQVGGVVPTCPIGAPA
jgi:hypothetical protein